MLHPVLPASVLAELRTLPVLDDAACRGLGGMWDGDALPGEGDDDRDSRHALAARVCRACPARRACAQLAVSLGDQITGVWAGRLRRARPDRPAA